MRFLTLVAVIAILSISVSPHLVAAKPLEAGQFGGGLRIGAFVFGKGQLHGGAASSVVNINPANVGAPLIQATLVIAPTDFSDVYDAPLLLGVELSYGLSDDIEVFGALGYSKAEGGRVQIGDANVPFANGTYPLFGTFGDLEVFELDLGARYFFAGERFQPFIGGSIGGVRQERVNASFLVANLTPTELGFSNVPFFKQTAAVAVGVEGGLSVSFNDKIDGRISLGARYFEAANGDDSSLAGLGLGAINDGSQRWVYPIKATLVARF